MKKKVLYSLMVSVSALSVAAYADPVPDATSSALTTKGYVDAGLKYVYDVANGTSNGAVKDLQNALKDESGNLIDVSDLADAVDDNATAIGALETAVGDANNGLVKAVADNTSDISALETTVGNASSGLVKRVNDLESSSIVYTAGDGIAVTPGANASDPSTIGLNISNVQNNTTYVYKTNGSGVGTWQTMEVEDSWNPGFLTNP